MANNVRDAVAPTWLEPIHQQWVATLDAIRDAIFVVDPSGRLVRMNRAFAELAGKDYAQLIGQHVRDVLPWLIDRHGRITDTIVAGPDGSMYRARETSASAELKGQVHILEDITEFCALEEAEEAHRKGSRLACVRTIDTLLKALAAQDPYTVMHCSNVADLATKIAVTLGLEQPDVEGIYYSAKVHDIGKLSVPASILNKPGRLVPAEINLIRLHCEAGNALLLDHEFPWPVKQVVLQHHERLDGTGYPAGLSCDRIDKAARIVAVADVAEAMSAHRPYRPSRGIDAALDELTSGKGTLYDPDAVDACIRVLDEDESNTAPESS